METNPVEATTDAAIPEGPSVAACQPPASKHGLHGVCPGTSVPPGQAETAGRSSSDIAGDDADIGKQMAPELHRRLQLTTVLERVCKHYGVAGGSVALARKEGNGVIDFIAVHGASAEAEAALRRHGAERAHPDDLKLFRHHMRRELPIIIQDTSKVKRLRGHRLVTGTPNIKFYAAAPLISAPGQFIGTISIFDATEWSAFVIEDCEMLQRAAADAIRILSELS